MRLSPARGVTSEPPTNSPNAGRTTCLFPTTKQGVRSESRPRAVQADDRMQMACERERPLAVGVFHGMMPALDPAKFPPASGTRKAAVGIGSPAPRSWLPGTIVKCSGARRARQAQSRIEKPRRHGGARMGEIAQHHDMFGPCRCRSVRRGGAESPRWLRSAGAPNARKVAALPRCRSATNRMFAAGAKTARSGRSFKAPSRTASEAFTRRPPFRAAPPCGRCAPTRFRWRAARACAGPSRERRTVWDA